MYKVSFYFLIITGGFLLIPSGSCRKAESNTITDIDGNVYHTIKIGSQLWLVENLKVTRYRNGDLIPNITDTAQWRYISMGAYCNYENDNSKVATYGRLYNWYAVNDSRGIAPKGFHIPSFEELEILINYLGGNVKAAGKMKETGTSHWLYPNSGATNETGFTALPGGYRFKSDGTFHTMKNNGYWWTTLESFEIYAWDKMIHHHFADVTRNPAGKNYGFSVRCVKD